MTYTQAPKEHRTLKAKDISHISANQQNQVKEIIDTNVS